MDALLFLAGLALLAYLSRNRPYMSSTSLPPAESFVLDSAWVVHHLPRSPRRD